MSWNPWGVAPGQAWVHPEHVILVLREAKRETFECLVLHDADGAWQPGSIVLQTAYLVQAGGELT